MLRSYSVCAFAVALLIFLGADARANLIFETPAGSTQASSPVDARATFTLSTNTVSVLLENLQVDAASAAQCLSGLKFHIGSGQSSGTLTSSSGVERIVDGDGSFADGSTVSTGWALNTVGSDLMLNLLGTPTAPIHEIIGPPDAGSVYTGNASITNGAHNPHIGLSATFVLNVPGVTSTSDISSAVFQFNTSPGDTTTGQSVPEPASLGLAAAMMLFSAARRRRRC